MTQRDLAQRAEVSVGALRDLEQGRSTNPRIRFIDSISDVLEADDAQRSLFRRLATPPRSPSTADPGPVGIAVLGPFLVGEPSKPVSLGTGRRRVMLARLALTPGHPVSREELIRLLWTDEAPRSAANIVQTHASRIRRLLEPSPRHRASPVMLSLTSGGYVLHADEERLDLLAFRSKLLQWRRISAVDPQRGFDILAGAVDLWRSYQAVEDVSAAGR